MEAPTWLVPAVALLVAATLLHRLLGFLTPSHHFGRKNLPPGPKPWPIIGNLSMIGHLPHQTFHELSKKYGELMQLHYGSFPVVVASSSEMAKLFLKTNDRLFASRPQTSAGKYTTYNYCNITWAPYGPYWRQGRKIYLTEIFSPKRLDSYEHIRVEERRDFISRLHASSEKKKAITLKDHLSRLTLSIISRIVLGEKYFSEDDSSEGSSHVVTLEEFQEMLDELFLLNGVLNVGDWIPWIAFLDLQGYVKRMKSVSEKFDRFHDYVLEKHRARRQEADFVPSDMVDMLLNLADDPALEVELTTDKIKGIVQDLIAGGTDTSATNLEWAMSEILRQPRIAEKATEQLDRVIGRERWVEEKDIPDLPYIDAIVKETMRLHPVAVLLAPHQALQDCKVAGYDIRQGTQVLINTWSIGRDPNLWDAPEEFRPERFLGNPIDVRGQSFELLPFGSGRRMCPGYGLGLKMILTTLANMLHGFHWKLPEGVKAEELSMEEVFGLATPRLSLSLDSQLIFTSLAFWSYVSYS